MDSDTCDDDFREEAFYLDEALREAESQYDELVATGEADEVDRDRVVPEAADELLAAGSDLAGEIDDEGGANVWIDWVASPRHVVLKVVASLARWHGCSSSRVRQQVRPVRVARARRDRRASRRRGGRARAVGRLADDPDPHRAGLDGQRPLAGAEGGSRASWKGISGQVLAAAGIHADEAGRTIVPYRKTDGTDAFVKVFAPDGRTWYWPAGVELIPYGLETLPPPCTGRYRAALVAEGESDFLALWEAFQLREDARAIAYHVIGLPGAGTWRPEWRVFLAPFHLVYLLGDGDRPGRAMNRAVRRDVPWARPVELPDGEDARSLLQAGGIEALLIYLNLADANARIAAALDLSPDLDEFRRLLGAGSEEASD